MNLQPIIGVARIDAHDLECEGNIEIVRKIDNVAYVTWRAFDKKKNLIACVSKNYFIGNREFSDKEIHQLALSDMLKYKIDRKYIFEKIEFSS